MAACNICHKRVLSHAYHLKCSNCHENVHLKCLPMVEKDDSIYVERHRNNWFCINCNILIFPFNCIDEHDEFLEAMYEMQSTQPSVHLDLLLNDQKLFSPFELNENTNHPLFDIDPDVHFYSNQCGSDLQSCEYYFEDSFNHKISQLNIRSDCVSILHSNIRSTHKNLSKLENYLSSLSHNFQIIGISESWLREENNITLTFHSFALLLRLLNFDRDCVWM